MLYDPGSEFKYAPKEVKIESETTRTRTSRRVAKQTKDDVFFIISYHGACPGPNDCIRKFVDDKDKKKVQTLLNHKAKYITSCQDQCSVLSYQDDFHEKVLGSNSVFAPSNEGINFFKNLFLDDNELQVFKSMMSPFGSESHQYALDDNTICHLKFEHRPLVRDWYFDLTEHIPYKGIWEVREDGIHKVFDLEKGKSTDKYDYYYFSGDEKFRADFEGLVDLITPDSSSLCLSDFINHLRNRYNYNYKGKVFHFLILSCHHDPNCILKIDKDGKYSLHGHKKEIIIRKRRSSKSPVTPLLSKPGSDSDNSKKNVKMEYVKELEI